MVGCSTLIAIHLVTSPVIDDVIGVNGDITRVIVKFTENGIGIIVDDMVEGDGYIAEIIMDKDSMIAKDKGVLLDGDRISAVDFDQVA